MTTADTTLSATFMVEAPADLIQLAAPIVAIHLAVTQTEAARQLRQGSVHISSARAAARLLPLLQALGFAPTMVAEQPGSVALQVIDAAHASLIAPAVARALHRDESAVLFALRHPGGLVLSDLSSAQAFDLQHSLRRVKGLQITRAVGLYDLFAVASLKAPNSHGLRRHLAVLGLVPCRFSGAVAAGLTPLQVAQIRARFKDDGLQAVNRAFQRFDLFLTGTNGLPAEDVAAFLSTRADLSGAMVEAVTPLCPLQIERGLTRTSALQFQADYASIGLQTCARLARH